MTVADYLSPLQIGVLQILDREPHPGALKREFLQFDQLAHELFGTDTSEVTDLELTRALNGLVRAAYIRRVGSAVRATIVAYIITSAGQAWLALHALDTAGSDPDDLTPEQERIHDLERTVRLLWKSRRHWQERL